MMYYEQSQYPQTHTERWPPDALCPICNRGFSQGYRRAMGASDQTCSRVCEKLDCLPRSGDEKHG